MNLSQRLQEERVFVERALGDSVICKTCSATLKTYADTCSADLSEICDGFMTVEKCKAEFADMGGAR